MPEVRTVALDVGSKTIGLAEDVGAGPKPVRTHRRQSVAGDVAALLPWIGDADVVVGLPSYDDGGESASTRRARQVGEALAAAGRTVHYQDERFTTAEAEERLRDAGVPRARWPELVDAWAAAVILEDWRAGR